jgi:hypothetical protein
VPFSSANLDRGRIRLRAVLVHVAVDGLEVRRQPEGEGLVGLKEPTAFGRDAA